MLLDLNTLFCIGKYFYRVKTGEELVGKAWSSTTACGPAPVLALRDALRDGRSEDARWLTERLRWAHEPFLVGQDFMEFSKYNIPLEKIRVNEAGYIHAKAAVIDGIATVGSSNLDPFSLLLAREANVIVDSKRFVADLKTRIEQGIAQSAVRIRRYEFRRRGWLGRVIDKASYALLRIGVALTGKSGSF